jgi:asparagine synthetase A
MAGIQAQNIAVVVSRVDQNVVGMLSQVGSAVRPNVRRLSSRTMEVIHTLKKNKVNT